MSYTVAIRNNSTNETRIYCQDYEWETDFGWMEGNFSCDCNRHNIFYDSDDDTPCSEGKYSVLYADLPNGDRVFLEGDPYIYRKGKNVNCQQMTEKNAIPKELSDER